MRRHPTQKTHMIFTQKTHGILQITGTENESIHAPSCQRKIVYLYLSGLGGI